MSVRADDERAELVERLLNGRSGVDALDRGAAYRQDGWTGYSPDAPAYSADEIARERSRYGGGEVRSFGDRDPMGEDDLGVERDPAVNPGPLGRNP